MKCEHLTSIIANLELYKVKIYIEDDNKICLCKKKLYEKAVTGFQYILMSRFFGIEPDRNKLKNCFFSAYDVDSRMKKATWLLIEQVFNSAIEDDFNFVIKNRFGYLKALKLFISGMHLNCENMFNGKKNECFYKKANCEYCSSHKFVVKNGEYIRLYVFSFLINRKPEWILNMFDILKQLHKNIDDVVLIIDYKNISPEESYCWNEETYKRWKVAKKLFKNVYIINYNAVNFGAYISEVKQHFSTEDKLFGKKEDENDYKECVWVCQSCYQQ